MTTNDNTTRCEICGCDYHEDGGVEMFITDSGKNFCEYCREDCIVYDVIGIGNIDHKFYGHAEYKQDEITTGYFTTKYQAKARIIEFIDAMEAIWGDDVERVEK